jgi:hypothetical protein
MRKERECLEFYETFGLIWMAGWLEYTSVEAPEALEDYF